MPLIVEIVVLMVAGGCIGYGLAYRRQESRVAELEAAVDGVLTVVWDMEGRETYIPGTYANNVYRRVFAVARRKRGAHAAT